jgi:hypothetical protein
LAKRLDPPTFHEFSGFFEYFVHGHFDH